MNKKNNKSQISKGNQSVTKQQVQSMLGSVKVRRFWAGTSTATYPSTTTFFDLTAVAVGTGNNTRTGQEIHAKKLELDMLFVIADTYNIVRVIFFEWLPSDTSDSPNANEIYSTAYSAGNNEQYCCTNPLKPSRFKVLRDMTVVLDVAHVAQHKHVSLRLNNRLMFDTGVTTGRNHVYMAIVSDSSAVSHPTVAYTWVLSFEE
jgi:hypothetical protein